MEDKLKQMAEMWQSGYSLTIIADRYGMSRQRIHQIFKKNNITKMNLESTKLISEFLITRREYTKKWKEIYEDNGEKNISAVNVLINDTDQADDLFISERKLKDYYLREEGKMRGHFAKPVEPISDPSS